MENPDAHLLFDIILAIAGFLGAVFVKNVMKALKDLEDKMAEMPMIYVLKEDYVEDIREIKNMLKEIYVELRRKQDKAGY
jgi:flagellar motor component MotA